MTYLAVPIIVTDIDSADQQIKLALQNGAELLELRLDYLTDPTSQQVHTVIEHARQTNLPIIATCRASWEGGHFQAGEKSRKALLKQAVRAGADYLDIESACRDDGEIQIDDITHGKHSPGIIRSNHDFNALPTDLSTRLSRLTGQKPDIAKVAYQARSINDCFALLDWARNLRHSDRDVIAIAMGEAGLLTRLTAKKLGQFLTFAANESGQSTAPGQVTLTEMKTLYRWDHLDPQTKLFGVIGCPIAHSMSPLIHNTAFDATGFNGLYLPLRVEPTWAEFRTLLDHFRDSRWLDMTGLSVTIPHKEHALRYVESTQGHVEPLAAKIGAVNTIIWQEDGTLAGYNTDYAGALDALLTGGNLTKADLANLPAAVIGAGGVARAVVAGLTDAQAHVTIYNRTPDKARLLADEFGAQAAPLDQLPNLDAKIIVNCTSLGMHGYDDTSPIPENLLRPDHIVFDTVYNPVETLLLRQSLAAGATVVTGVDMFVNQAALQFTLFTQLQPPKELMAKIVLQRLTADS